MSATDPGRESFIGESIAPRPGSFHTAPMATGGPGLPRIFTWRGADYEVAVVLQTWRTRDPGVGMDKHHLYVRKHWYKIRTKTGEVMTICFDHKPPGGRAKHKQRWFLFSRA